MIALLHRPGFNCHKPEVIPRKLDVDKQKAFIAAYESLLNCLPDNEIVVFADAVHPAHAARPAGCWAPKGETLAIKQTSGRQRINIHGAIDLETGETRMIEALTIDAASTIRLLESIELAWPLMVFIHVCLDNARYHHAQLVREWLERPGCRIKLRFVPACCPHLNPIERLWGVMHKHVMHKHVMHKHVTHKHVMHKQVTHKHVTHNKTYASCGEFANATLRFLQEKVPRNWSRFRDSVTDNFRVINPKDLRVVR